MTVVHTGDSLLVLRTLPGASVHAVITDPPYGMSYQSNMGANGPRFEKLVGDDKPAVEFIPDAARALKEGGCMFVFCEWRYGDAFRDAMRAAGLTIRSQVVWDRETTGMGDLEAQFSPSHDLAWFATKGTGFAFHGKRPPSVLRFPRVPADRLQHPTEKPVNLMRALVATLSPRGGVVLDPYGGSGTTGVAAVLECREAILCEIVPEYADLARRRIAAAENGTDHRVPQQGGLWAPLPGTGYDG